MPTFTGSPVVSSVPGAYCSVNEADTYLNARYNTQAWSKMNSLQKEQLLVTSTSWIDRLSFCGDKTDEDQELEFPRGGDTVVPTDIKRACILCALEMAKGKSPEEMINMQSKTAEGGQALKDTFNRWFVEAHQRAGIVSAEAWHYLAPYLRDPLEIKLSRTS